MAIFDSMRRWRNSISLDDPRQPCLISLWWFFIGWAVALLLPWLEPAAWPIAILLDTAHCLLPWITTALIIWNLTIAVRIVGRTGRPRACLPTTFALFLLFVLYFFQLACHFGAHHFRYDYPPGGGAWLVFGIVHALRAGDLIDLLQAYGFRLQTIRHASTLAAFSLVIFHLTLDFLVLSWVIEWSKPLRRWWDANLDRSQLPTTLRQVAIGFALLVVLTGLLRSWSWFDFILLPLDSGLRVVDCADIMDLFDLRLVGLPASWLEGTIQAVLRIALALALGGALSLYFRQISLRWLGGFGLTRAELEEVVLEHHQSPLGDRAARRLLQLKAYDSAAPPTFQPSRWFTPRNLAFLVSGVVAWLLIIPWAGSWDARAARLAEIAVEPDHPRARRAVTILTRAGSNAHAAAPLLHQALSAAFAYDHELGGAIIDALCAQESFLAPRSTSLAEHHDLRNRWYAALRAKGKPATITYEATLEFDRRWIVGLGRSSPKAAVRLFNLMGQANPPKGLQAEARAALLSLGPEAAQTLIDHLPPPTTSGHQEMMKIIRALDRFWFARETNNRHFQPKDR